jgi:hypothetical protein
MFWRLFCPDRWVQKGREYQLDSFAPPVEPVTSALADGREGVLVRSLHRQEQESHGETGFGLVYPSLRILRKSTRSSSCWALSWRLPI